MIDRKIEDTNLEQSFDKTQNRGVGWMVEGKQVRKKVEGNVEWLNRARIDGDEACIS